MSRFSIEITGSLQAAQDLAKWPDRARQIQQRAIATMRRKTLTEAKRDIGREYKLTASRIAQGLYSRNTEQGVIIAGKGRAVNAIQFGAKWTRTRRGRGAGARYTFRRAEAPKAHPGTFIATGINGVRLVFYRDKKTPPHRVLRGFNAGRMKQGIKGAYGPTLAQMLKHGDRPQRLGEFAVGILDQEVDRQIGRSTRA